MAVAPYFNGPVSNKYMLVAVDSDLNMVATSLTLRVTTSALLKVSHAFTMNILTDYQLFVSELSHAIWWTGNVSAYFSVSLDDVTVLSITEGSEPGLMITWSNNSINNVNPPYSCPIALIYSNFDRLRGQAFTAALNQFTIRSLTLRLQGICEGISTSTTTQSTSTTTPITTSTTPTTTSSTTTPTTTTSTTTMTTTSMYELILLFSVIKKTHSIT